MMARLLTIVLCLMVFLAKQNAGLAQDFKTRQKEILKKVNATMDASSKEVPELYVSVVEAKLDSLDLKGEERETIKQMYLSWFKALGKSEKKDDNGAILADLPGADGEKQQKLAMTYNLAERVLVWRVHDPQLKYFVATTERDPLAKKLAKTQLEQAIVVLETAQRGKLFVGYPNECDVKMELMVLQKRFKELQKGPLK